jgi:hypothetical protein
MWMKIVLISTLSVLAWPAAGMAGEEAPTVGGAPLPGQTTRFQPVDGGYQLVGSTEVFNRPLYGGHAQDDLPERFVTLAGDQPVVLGVITDWRKQPACLQAKCGTLLIGMAMDHDASYPVVGNSSEDRFSQWFHQSRGTVSTFRNGWMEHIVRPFFQCAASVEAAIEVLPLSPEAGFLVHLRLHADQQIHLVIGFGGVTDFLGRLEFPSVTARNFSPEDCKGNKITLDKNWARVESSPGVPIQSSVAIAASFPAEVSLGDPAKALVNPGQFLAGEYQGDRPMVRMHFSVGPGRTLDGFLVVARNVDDAAIERWLVKPDPAAELKAAIRRKHEAVEVATPDAMLDLTVVPSVLASDACWHGNTFYHGTLGWHAPYLGWRNWYGPTVLGWHDRVAKAIRTHAATQVWPEKIDPAAERVVKGDGPYSRLENSYGYIPEMLGRGGIFYNMQEVYVDHLLHHLEWTGDLKLAAEVFPVVSRVLDWEARILDPEGDGMYQNWLNTWISDAHSYNGGNCAQASAYNYRANRTMAAIAARLGRDPKPFEARAEKIKQAVQKTLWLPERGVLAEYQDTLGNKLVHPSPELPTIYHAIEAGLIDPFQAYQVLRFTETDLRNERSASRGGRLVWSSNWYPQVYSSCGLYAAENLHLAWAYYRCGLARQGAEILRAVADAHFTGDTPGCVAHCMAGGGYSSGVLDFAEIPSLMMRTIVEGLFGVRFDLLHGQIEIAPHLPADWDHARLRLPDVTLDYRRSGQQESLIVNIATPGRRIIRLPMRGTAIDRVTLDGKPCPWHVEPGLARCDVVIETERSGELKLEVLHGGEQTPQIQSPLKVSTGDKLTLNVDHGALREIKTPTEFLDSPAISGRSLTGLARERPGWHTLFLRIEQGQWNGWLPVNVEVSAKSAPPPAEPPKGQFTPVDLAKHFNVALADIHRQKYRDPRPAGYSIMAQLNGRFLWDWNQGGYQQVRVDDSRLRGCGGVFKTPSGIPFRTPAEGPNVACASVWDNFPDEIAIPLEGKGTELAVLLVGVTNPMQSRVENGRLTVHYRDGSQETLRLINPLNFDDWLVAATQNENETVSFSDYNHAIVARIRLDSVKELKSLMVGGIANEVIVGVLGVSLRRESP